MAHPDPLAGAAKRALVELHEMQRREIRAALKEADAGDFAKPAEVEKILSRWRKLPSQW